jgi:hypothetical protein
VPDEHLPPRDDLPAPDLWGSAPLADPPVTPATPVTPVTSVTQVTPVTPGDTSVSSDRADGPLVPGETRDTPGPVDPAAAPGPPGPVDPAAAPGPPGPALIASPGYRPPPLIRWPIALGVAAVATAAGLLVSSALSTRTAPTPQVSWLVAHDSAILKLNRDQSALRTGNPATGGSTSRWLTEWRTFHDDAVAAADLPNPGGPATAPWREMLNDYVNGSTEITQAVATRNTQELDQAQRDLAAGDQAAHAFNQAMGIPTP